MSTLIDSKRFSGAVLFEYAVLFIMYFHSQGYLSQTTFLMVPSEEIWSISDIHLAFLQGGAQRSVGTVPGWLDVIQTFKFKTSRW